MRAPEGVKRERIVHLEYCLEDLMRKDNGYNTNEVDRLVIILWDVIVGMKELEPVDAIWFCRENIDDEVKKALRRFNIELRI